MNIYDDALRPMGVRINQVFILVLTSRFAKVSTRELRKTLQLDVSTLSRNLARMKRNGWIRTSPDGEGAQLVEVTAAGTRVLKKTLKAWEGAQKEVEKLFPLESLEHVGKMAALLQHRSGGLLRNLK